MVLIIRKKVILLSILGLVLAGGFSRLASVGDVKETAALPLSDKVIVLDAGHGGEDGGATGAGGTVEKNVNLAVMKKLQALLEQSGCTVMTSRTEDISLHESGDEKTGNRKIKDLDARRELPDKYKQVVLLYYYSNLTLQDTAEALGIPKSTAGKRLKRAEEMLRHSLTGGEAQ